MRYFVLFLVALYGVSCANDLDLVAEYKETPVVYGLLNPSDTAQYIRVERTFIDKAISGTVLAQNPDSLYYEGIAVKLIRLSNGDEFTLERVDGNLEGYEREEGIFAQAPNYLYKILTDDIPLIEEEEYELRVEGIFEDRAVTATTTLLKKPFFASPQDEGIITFERNKNINIGWNPKGDPTIYSASFFFNIRETRLGVTEDRLLEWIVVRNTEKTSLDILGVEFYSFLSGALEKDPEITRKMGKAEFELVAGNEVVADYLRVAQANLGITSSGEIPNFSNLSEGLGIFGGKVSERRIKLNLRDITIDSLINSPITADLNFE